MKIYSALLQVARFDRTVSELKLVSRRSVEEKKASFDRTVSELKLLPLQLLYNLIRRFDRTVSELKHASAIVP